MLFFIFLALFIGEIEYAIGVPIRVNDHNPRGRLWEHILRRRGRSRVAVRVPGDGELPRDGRPHIVCGMPLGLRPARRSSRSAAHVAFKPEETNPVEAAASKRRRDKRIHGLAAASNPT